MKIIIIVFGLPATGKSTLAKSLAKIAGAKHINSDEIRKRLKLMGQYDEQSKLQIYEAMRKEMLEVLQQGDRVILDATFHKKDYRDLIAKNLPYGPSHIFYIQTTAEKSTIVARLKEKRLSEANEQVYDKLRSEYELVMEEYLSLPSHTQGIDKMTERAWRYINYFADG